MTEFKFVCPSCRQEIQCDTQYAGMEVTCPNCKKPIVMMPMPVDKPKSKAWQAALIITAAMIFLAGFGIGHWVGFRNSRNSSLPRGNAGRNVAGNIEGEHMKVIICTGGSLRTQNMAGWGMKVSDNAQLWWTGAKPGDRLELALPVVKAGKYQLLAQFTKAVDYGIVQLSLDDQELGEPKDFYHDGVIMTGSVDLGVRQLSAGEHKLVVEITGANPKALTKYMFGLDYVKLVEQK